MKCRFCKAELKNLVIDLGLSPLANSFLAKEKTLQKEQFHPLKVFVCEKCFLVQLVNDSVTPEEIFSDYVYFSSFSKLWMEHTKKLSDILIQQFSLDKNSQVIEIASNDGYMLKNFVSNNIPVLGIEPAKNICQIAEKEGIPTINKFFGKSTATELVENGKEADLLIAINVMPHVPDLHDFVSGLKILTRTNGVIVIQFSTYLLPFLENNEFDSIYHEHFSYFSLIAIQKILNAYELEIFDVCELSIHGGSLRIFVKHKQNNSFSKKDSVNKLEKKEIEFGVEKINMYNDFMNDISKLKKEIHDFFVNSKLEGKKIACYGAPAKGNTLLNFCELGKNFIDFTVDISPHKQGLFLPGTHIPIFHPDKIKEIKPDLLIILPWNLKEEIIEQMNFIKDWGGKFVTLIPKVNVI
jgi:hypothetical protein